jgi:hypothetical protein
MAQQEEPTPPLDFCCRCRLLSVVVRCVIFSTLSLSLYPTGSIGGLRARCTSLVQSVVFNLAFALGRLGALAPRHGESLISTHAASFPYGSFVQTTTTREILQHQ